MVVRVLKFIPVAKRQTQTVNEATKQSVNRLLNNLQIIAIQRPWAMAWLTELTSQIATDALAQQMQTITAQGQGQP